MYSGNPNTKYGRRKNRAEFQHRYNNEMTDEEKNDNDNFVWIALLIIVAIVVVLAFTCNSPEKALKYLSK
jgi:anti-sigma-K factor RskA